MNWKELQKVKNELLRLNQATIGMIQMIDGAQECDKVVKGLNDEQKGHMVKAIEGRALSHIGVFRKA